MTTLQLINTQPISREEARARLAVFGARPLNASRLALEWGWSRSKVRRLIERCQAEGLIPTRPKTAPSDKSATATPPLDQAASPEITASPDAPTVERQQLSTRTDAPGAPGASHNDNEWGFELPRRPGGIPPGPPPRVPMGNKLLALALGTGALTLGGVGLVLNVTFAQSFGRSALASGLLAILGGVIDVMTILLPTVAENLWRQRQVGAALAAWLIWSGVLMMTLIAASGFAATNIGDSTQNRADIVRQRDELNDKLTHLRTDRGAITEPRAPAAIQAAIQQEQPHIPVANWKTSVGCTNVTLSGKYCQTLNELRQAKADAERRDQLDTDIKSTDAELAKLPPVVAADPGADMAARLITAASLGVVNATPASIQEIRIAGLTLAPAVSGLLLMFAGLTWRPRREDDAVVPLV